MSANPHYTAVTCLQKAIARARARVDAAEARLAEEKARLADHHKELAALEDLCTHRYPDGRSAWKDNYFYGSCELCGADDY